MIGLLSEATIVFAVSDVDVHVTATLLSAFIPIKNFVKFVGGYRYRGHRVFLTEAEACRHCTV